jgi:hypothetical protein
MPDVFTQYREIGRLAQDFETKHQEAIQELDRLNTKMTELDNAANPPTEAELMECKALKLALEKLASKLRSSQRKASSIKKTVDEAPARLEEIVRKRIEEEARNLPQVQHQLMAAKIRTQVAAQLAEERSSAKAQTDAIKMICDNIKQKIDEASIRVQNIEVRYEAAKKQAANPTSHSTLSQRRNAVLNQINQAQNRREAFENKFGQKGILKQQNFISDLAFKVKELVASSGFIDLASVVERSIKSLPGKLHHTEITFIMAVVRDNTVLLNNAIDASVCVTSQVKDGDASPVLTSECLKFPGALKTLILSDESSSKAVRWWKNDPQHATPHIANITAMLETALKFRIVRFMKEDIATWTLKIKQ